MKRLLRKLPFVFTLTAPLVFAQYSYSVVDTTMAGPPAVYPSGWTTSNGGTDMLASGSNNGGEVRAVYIAGGLGPVEILLAASDCYNSYNGCFNGSLTNFTTGYTLDLYGGGGINLFSTWVNFNNGSPYLASFSLSSATTPTLQTGSVIRAIWRNDPAGGVDIIVYVDNALVLFYHDTLPYWAQSQPSSGIGFIFVHGPANTFVSEGDAGPLCSCAPNTIASITAAAFTNHVDLQWTTSTEPNGIGIYGYQILRNGVLLTTTTGLSYSDLTVVPSSTYTYTVRAVDYHWNTTDTNKTVTTPIVPTGVAPSATPDGFRTGVKPTGAYWGAGNENIDVMSGNLSFSLPLLNARARTNWSVPFKLSYNSQAWGMNASGPLMLGSDVGFGFGWRLMAGSITPFWVGNNASLYMFTDSTGAEYRLDQNNGNIWSSKESTYVYFDANLDVLHFRDGSFWLMGCVSSGLEEDPGVMYPTVMEDTNGNQIQITYNIGFHADWANSSSRIHTIQDVRGSTNTSTYTFTYNSDYPVPHLTAITNSIASGEQYTFAPATAQTVVTNPLYINQYFITTLLNSVTVTGPGVVTSFSYNGAGEMTQAVLPYGGYLKWDYDTVTYSSGVSYREVQHRYLSKDGTTGSQTTYTFSHEPTISAPIHQYTIIDDPGGVGEKYYAFGQQGVGKGLVTQYQGRQRPGPVTKTQNDFTWARDGVGNSYISSTLTTLDPGQSYQAQSMTTQSVDIYGNVTQVNSFNYGNLSTPAPPTTTRT